MFTMLTGGDWRDSSSSEIDTLVSFINSSKAGIFIGLGDYLQTDTPTFRSRITIPAKWIKGNHDGSTDKWNGLYNWNGIQLLSGGFQSNASILNQLDETKPSMYFQHVQFVQESSCTIKDHPTDTAMQTALKAKKLLIGGGCGHAHTYSTFFGSDRILMQSGTPAGIRYCKGAPGNDGWYFGYWEFDDSVNKKLTVKYYRVTVANTFSKSSTPDKTFTVDFIPKPPQNYYSCSGTSCNKVDSCSGTNCYTTSNCDNKCIVIVEHHNICNQTTKKCEQIDGRGINECPTIGNTCGETPCTIRSGDGTRCLLPGDMTGALIVGGSIVGLLLLYRILTSGRSSSRDREDRDRSQSRY